MNRKNLKFYVGCLGFWVVMSGILFSLVWSRNPPVLETINVNSRQEFTAPKREVYEMKDGEKICYLTFDDGPSKNTIKILDILCLCKDGLYNSSDTIKTSAFCGFIKNSSKYALSVIISKSI